MAFPVRISRLLATKSPFSRVFARRMEFAAEQPATVLIFPENSVARARRFPAQTLARPTCLVTWWLKLSFPARNGRPATRHARIGRQICALQTRGEISPRA